MFYSVLLDLFREHHMGLGNVPGCRGWAGRSSRAQTCGGGGATEYGKAGGNGSRPTSGKENGWNVAKAIGRSEMVSK